VLEDVVEGGESALVDSGLPPKVEMEFAVRQSMISPRATAANGQTVAEALGEGHQVAG
jgi:hypothetical protein